MRLEKARSASEGGLLGAWGHLYGDAQHNCSLGQVRASCAHVESGKMHRAACSGGPTLGLMLCCHSVEILNNFLTKVPIFSFYTWIRKLYSWSWAAVTMLSPYTFGRLPTLLYVTRGPQGGWGCWGRGLRSKTRFVHKTLCCKFLEGNSDVSYFVNFKITSSILGITPLV